MRRGWVRIILVLVGVALLPWTAREALRWYWYGGGESNSNAIIGLWLNDPAARADLNTAGGAACPPAPFILPSSGLIGLLWRDPAAPYTVLRRHTGIDIFGAGTSGTVPVFAVYAGRLTREADWLSTVIIQHEDPLQAGRIIWTYYTHMASRDGRISYVAREFPPGTSGVPVRPGTLLGFQGEYAGAGATPIAMHVHISIVRSAPDGSYLNEAVLENTLDPSPYFGLPLDIARQPPRPIRCPAT